MEANVGGTDRAVRLVAGGALLGAAALAPIDGRVRALMGVGGVAALGTALTGYCSVNAALGINTSEGAPIDFTKEDFAQLPQIETGASAAGMVSG